MLELNGLGMQYFQSQEEALRYADELIKQSEIEFGYVREVVETDGFPLLARFKYIKSDGKERSWTASETKTGEKRAAPSQKQLQDSEKSVQAFLGDSNPSLLVVKPENANYAPKALEKELGQYRLLQLRNKCP